MEEGEVRVARGLRILGPWPVMYLEEESAILVSDLHLGIEDKYEREGVHIPRTFLPRIIESITAPARRVAAKKIIFLGDVKHEFGRPEEGEWYSVRRLMKACREVVQKIEVVKGNHDNYIASILADLGIPLHSPTVRAGRYVLVHGHEPVPDSREALIMGHEHPAVRVRDDLGTTHRYKAFIDAKVDSRRVYILPSASPITIGTDMNATPSSQFLSPVIRGKDISRALPYLVEPGVAVRRFPELGLL